MRASSQRLKVRRSLQRRQSDPARRLPGQQSIPRMTNQATRGKAAGKSERPIAGEGAAPSHMTDLLFDFGNNSLRLRPRFGELRPTS